MEKLLKYLMLALITTFSVCLTSCGDNDKDEPDIPGNPSEIQDVFEVTASWGGYFSFNQQCGIECSTSSDGDYIQSKRGGSLVYIPTATSLNSIKNIPSTGWDQKLPYKEGGYIVEYITHGKSNYVRCWVTSNYDASGNRIGYTVKWQDMR